MTANTYTVTAADVRTAIEQNHDSIRRLIAAHPRAERIAQMEPGITPLQLTDDCRRAAATIRWHRSRIVELEAMLPQIESGDGTEGVA